MRCLCLAAALIASSPALAVTTFTQSPSSGISNPVTATSDVASGGIALSGATTYASQGIAGSAGGGTAIIPGGLAFTIGTQANTAAGETAGVLTISLPAGVAFATVPTATLLTQTATGPIASLNNTGANYGSSWSTIIFHFSTAASVASSTSTIQLSTFTISGANALTTPGNSITITAALSGLVTNAQTTTNGVTSSTGLNDTKPITGQIAVSANGVSAAATAGPGDTIAIATGTIGTAFNSNDLAAANGAPTQTVIANVADLGKVSVTPNSAALNAPASAAQFTAASTGTLVVNGIFSSYAKAYYASGGSCLSSAVPGDAIPGVVSPTGIVFNGVTLSGNLRAICLVGTGSTLLAPTGPVSASFIVGGQSTFVGSLGSNGIAYAGTPFNLTYVFAQSGNYQGYLRLVNTTAQSAPLFAIATTDSGAKIAGLIATVPPQSSQLITHDQAFAAMGAGSLFTSGTRGIMTVLTPAPAQGAAIPGVSSGNAAGVSVTSVIANPNGTLTNVY